MLFRHPFTAAPLLVHGLALLALAVPPPAAQQFPSTPAGQSSSPTPVALGTLAFTPTQFRMAYGAQFTLDPATCSTGGTVSCNVTFSPHYPGFTQDALIASDGSGNTASRVVQGTGLGPLATVFPGTIATFYNGDANIVGIAIDPAGNIYFSNRLANVVKKINTQGVVTLVAGNSTAGYSGDGGPGPAAQLNQPSGLALDALGNLYIADRINSAVRRVDRQGNITTVAGNGAYGFFGDGGAATFANFALPNAVAFDAAGNLYIADTNNNRIRKVDSQGIVTTVAGGGGADSGDNGPATSAVVSTPMGVVVDASGNLYIAEQNAQVIRKVDTQGMITTLAGTRYNGGYSGDGGPALSAQLAYPTGLGFDAAGNMYIADSSSGRIRRVDAQGNISTVAGGGADFPGDGEPATSARLFSASTVVVGPDASLYFGDGSLRQVKLGPFNFPDTSVGATNGLRTVNVLNIGNQDLNLSALAASGDFPINGSSTCTTATVLPNNSPGCALSIAFAPTNGGSRTGILTLRSQQQIALNGLGVGLTVSTSTLTFTLQPVGSASASQTVTVTNGTSNSAAISLSGTNAADFSKTDTCGGTVAPNGGTCMIAVTFAPTAAGSRSAVVAFGGSSQTVSLSGVGGQAQLSLSASSLTFGNQLVGATGAGQTATVTNTGNIPMTISGITITGANASDFSRTTTCGASLAMGASCSATVTFTPSALGTRGAALSIADNAPGSPQGVMLAGTGTSISISATPSQATLGQPVALTATFGGALPGGKVLFLDGMNPLGYGTVSAGTATFTTRLLPAGVRSLQARLGNATAAATVVTVSSVAEAALTPQPALTGFLKAVSVAAADVNNDGFIDLITTDNQGTQVGVSLGSAGGHFSPPVFYAVSGPYQTVVVDVNGDGNPDIVTSDKVNSTVHVLLGNYDGSFRTPVDSVAAANMTSMAAADFNQDGKIDLIVAYGNNTAVLLGNGDGTFTLQAGVSLGFAGGYIKVADFNGDGNADLALQDPTAITHIYLGNGDGTFTAGATLGTAQASGSQAGIAVGDFNGDGKTDIAGAAPSTTVYLGNGDGTFTAGASLNTPLAKGIGTGDMNGDGRADLVVWNGGNQHLDVYLGSGTGTFTPGFSSPGPGVSDPNFYSDSFTIADVSGDGRSDVVAAGYDAFVVVYLGIVSLPVSSTHTGSFAQGQTGATYSIVVSNSSTVSTAGLVTVVDTLPAGLTATAISGAGWTCTLSSLTCTRADAVGPVSSYPAITLTVNVAPNAPNSVTNTVTATNAAGASTASDPTSIQALTGFTIGPSIPGAGFSVDGTAYTTSQSFNFAPGSTHTVSAPATQTGAPGTRYVFASWSDGGAASHSITATGAPAAYTVTFAAQYQLMIGASPADAGSVTPASGGYYPSGAIVPISVTAQNGYNFTNWSGPVASATSAGTSVIMTAPVTVTAQFGIVPGVSVSSVSLSYAVGAPTAGLTQTIQLLASSPLGYQSTCSAAWLSLTPANGVAPGTSTLRFDPTGLAPGSYSAKVTYNFGAALAITVPVTFIVVGPPQLYTIPGAVSFMADAGSAVVTQTILLGSKNQNAGFTLSTSIATPAGGTWLGASSKNVNSPANLLISANPAGLAPGSYQGTVTVTPANSQSAPLAIPVTLVIGGGNAATMSIGDVLNGASFLHSAAAPNTLLSLFGGNLACDAPAQVMVNGTAAEVLGASATQINFVAPDTTPTTGQLNVVVSCNGALSNAFSMDAAPQSPGVFTVSQTGVSEGSILNVAMQPLSPKLAARRGDYILTFVTGFGQFGPAGADGLQRLTANVTATVGGVPADVQYAGESPGITHGVQQINVLVPQTAPTGDNVPVILTVNGVSTQLGVTVPIE